MTEDRPLKACFDQPVSQERGWRDIRLSERHRRWGWNCPGIDIDFLFLEYDQGSAVALVEYKHEYAMPQFLGHPSYQALIGLGNRAGIPVFICRYKDDFSFYRVTSINHIAERWLPEQMTMSEREWVRFLYHIRGYAVPESVLDNLDKEI